MRVLIGIAAAAAAAGGLPPAVLAAWLLLGAVAGGLAGTWTWLTSSDGDHPLDVAVRTALVVGAAGLLLGGAARLLGPVTPVVVVAGALALAVALAAVPAVRRC